MVCWCAKKGAVHSAVSPALRVLCPNIQWDTCGYDYCIQNGNMIFSTFYTVNLQICCILSYALISYRLHTRCLPLWRILIFMLSGYHPCTIYMLTYIHLTPHVLRPTHHLYYQTRAPSPLHIHSHNPAQSRAAHKLRALTYTQKTVWS